MFYKVNFPNFNYKKFLRTSAIVLYTKHSMDVLTQNSTLIVTLFRQSLADMILSGHHGTECRLFALTLFQHTAS
jgi:hypothetical protein